MLAVYYVNGNHEASSPQYDELKTELETIGVSILEDEKIQIEYGNEQITLIGLSDPAFTLRGDLFGEVSTIINTKLNELSGDENGYTILLSHRPELFESYVSIRHMRQSVVFAGRQNVLSCG